MCKQVLNLILLFCAIDNVFNAVIPPDTDSDSSIDSEEFMKLFPDPKELTVENLPMIVAVALKTEADKEGLSLDEFLYFMRVGLQGKKNEKEGKAPSAGLTEQSVCDDILKLQTVSPDKVVKSEVAQGLKEMRERCAVNN